MSQTIQETIQHLHASLGDYIEATYHISASSLIRQRRDLLALDGVIHRIPYLESTPKYQTGEKFAEMKGLHKAALEAYSRLSKSEGELPRLLFDPPYSHQSDAVRQTLVNGKNLVVMTGTGSGKTESFLLPILGKLAAEAADKPDSFKEHTAVRALVLYPMNALVNDQLGRLRTLFGDPRLVRMFMEWAGRPARFARYTSRTPYAGVRESKKDTTKYKSFRDFYIEIEQRTRSEDEDERKDAQRLKKALKERGKWPSKPDLVGWFGDGRWQDRDGNYRRAVTLTEDAELITRHEVQANPPDLLVTNYSMLEYMLMRPIERTIFDRTREWLSANPTEKFLIVLDEAHLYRGAPGAEVGLLLRRLRDRLDIPPERFQVICATASFNDAKYAPDFGAQISGISAETFVPITGKLDLRGIAASGTDSDAEVLAGINLDAFYAAEADDARLGVIKPLLEYRQALATGGCELALFEALKDFGPMGLLINTTMTEARPVSELGKSIFPNVDAKKADAAITALMALGSIARQDPKASGLLPCRVHNFFRGLPGLWACMNPACTEIGEELREGICGKLYSQPIAKCGCGSRVLQLFTCRNCGTAYSRAYTDNVDTPDALWAEPGRRLRMAGGEAESLLPIDLLLETPANEEVAEVALYDLDTGRMNPRSAGSRTRTVYLRSERILDTADENEEGEEVSTEGTRGLFVPCAVCGKTARGRTTVQDHQTKGDQPFQALVARQIGIQPPGVSPATRFAPLRGRKVLTFSDSRQVAARLAPNLQMYSVRDSLRPLIAWGYTRLQAIPELRSNLNLERLYFAVLLASKKLGVRLRPELRQAETFQEAEATIELAVAEGRAGTDAEIRDLFAQLADEDPPTALLENIVTTVQDKFLGLEALALASIVERESITPQLIKLPDIPGLAVTPEEKISVVRAWLRCWQNNGFWLRSMPENWMNRPSSEGVRVRAQKGKFKAMDRIVRDKAAKKIWDKWIPVLNQHFTSDVEGKKRLSGAKLSLKFDGEWVHCRSCKSVHRPIPGLNYCLDCESADVAVLDPESDEVFGARKGFYRQPVLEALKPEPRQPMALIAAEHTAQLNAPQNDDVFSQAEANELLFQDIALSSITGRTSETAIDVLSSTTTMEVGIDLGALTGVALRNMPPGRANYQQRAGRAGRRGNAVATVVAFGSADSHDEHYFSNPDGMIRGKVIDPKLTLDNREIVRRHVRAFLLQNYHQQMLPTVDPEERHDLFSVLGTVAAFRNPTSILSREGFAVWLRENEVKLKARVESWIPTQLSAEDRKLLLDEMVEDALKEVDDAIRPVDGENAAEGAETTESESDIEEQAEEGEERPRQASTPSKLLDRLLYCGKLPRYAFPTDVATFHVFDRGRSTPFRPIMKFAPSQGLPIALSQYAPGKQVWISGKCYTSAAIYSVMSSDRYNAWEARQLYFECSDCGFAETRPLNKASRGDTEDCKACGGPGTFGPARNWLRPPGFAHPIFMDEVTSPDDMPDTSYATRAKLTMGSPEDAAAWVAVNDRIRGLSGRERLLVSNTGPDSEGYRYCAKCGRIEAMTETSSQLVAPHRVPYPEKDEKLICNGDGVATKLVLGTDFLTDIALFSMRIVKPLTLRPALFSTAVALRTVSEAMAKAACDMLGIESGELMAEFRPALTQAGKNGLEAEIFLYDTLPGGAGFARQLPGRGLELYQRALKIMESCPSNCDASCYRCLRSFKNKFEHGLLDRHVGIELFKFLLHDDAPTFSASRLLESTKLLALDLERQSVDGFEFEAGAPVTVSGISFSAPILVTGSKGQKAIVALSGALSDGHPADRGISDIRDSGADIPIIVENELTVRNNLPAATRSVLEQLGCT